MFKDKITIILIFIVLIGAFFRLYNLNWDNNSHLHPDERFLTMVGNAMKAPGSLPDYLNSSISTFNPRNVGFDFYVYGTFPIVANKLIAILINTDTYNDFTIQGRLLSAILDIFVIILIYKSVEIFEKKYSLNKYAKVFAALSYSLFVLPIQLSHFFAVDTFLNFFIFSSFYFSLKYWDSKKFLYLFLSSILIGLGVSSKITAVFAFPLIIFLIAFFNKKSEIKRSVINIFLFLIIAFVTVKIADPALFNPGFFSIFPNKAFMDNIESLRDLSDKNSLFPPNIQWINKLPILFPLKNLVIFGTGIFAIVLFVLGIFSASKSKGKYIFGLILMWCALIFVYQGIQTTTTMRYFLILYPFIAIFAGVGLSSIKDRRLLYFTILLLFITPLFFFSIYTKPHTRVEATVWINTNLPKESVILTEHWDDSLPLSNSNGYTMTQLPVFDVDNSAKWDNMNKLLATGDYLILSSNRGWGSIMTVPNKYPTMSVFYQNLFAGKLQYKLIKEFTSYPSLKYIGIPLSFRDDSAEEAFTVYDHPRVMIFKKSK